MDGLEAHYALLREVSARGHAVQTRLRTSLPLLWTDSALVMHSAARDSSSHDARRSDGPSASARRSPDVDAVERLLGEWSGTGRRRRVEWEVSRRIARVERELQTKPKARRYWHKAVPEVPAVGTRAMTRAVERVPRIKHVSSAVQTEARTTRSRRSPRGKPAEPNSTKATRNDGHYMLPTASWKANTAASDAADPPLTKRDVPKSKQRRAANDDLDEVTSLSGEARTVANQPPSPPSKAASAASRSCGESPHESDGRRAAASTSLLSLSLGGVNSGETSVAIEPQEEEVLQTGRDLPSDPNESESVQDEEQTFPHTKENRSASATVARPSSIGRQVLSDYRTMPSVASFGPGPAASGYIAGPGHRSGRTEPSLNADVLRRLFNNLDSDHDGHISRIETCLALHRLQIAVPATKIASFFRNVCSSSSSSDKSSYRPLHEVISYKQFIAFVTAAFNRQTRAVEAEAAAKRARTKRLELAIAKASTGASDPEQSFPSTAVPMLQKRASASANIPVKAKACPVRELQRKTLRYEVEDVEPPGVTDSVDLTNRIVSEIPDLLVGQLLADVAREEQGDANAGRIDAKALVRKSLERLPRDIDLTEDDKMTTQLVRELIREHLQANLGGNFDGDSSQDLTGLRRAAAFFERQSQMNDVCGYRNEEAAPEKQSSSDWLEIVTEEQVSALIHEVWRESEKSNAVIVSTAEDDDPAEGHDDEVLLVNDSATQVTDGRPGHDATIADKAVQVECDDRERELQPSSAGPEKQTNEPRLVQTHLGRQMQRVVPDVQGSGTTISDVLHQLRRLRLDQRAHQRRGVSQETHTSIASDEQRESDDEGSRVSCISSASTGIKSPCDSLEGRSTAGDKENCSPLNTPDEAHEERETSERMTPEPMDSSKQLAEMQPLGEKRLLSFDLPRDSWSSSDARSSSSISRAIRSDSYSSSVESSHVSNAVDERVHRVHAQRRKMRAPARGCWSISNLSEGEVDLEEPGNTSEGEITGRRREKYTSVLNSSRRRQFQRPYRHQSSSEGLYSSVESGELHAHIISSLSSSRESGELHKVRQILSQRHAEGST